MMRVNGVKSAAHDEMNEILCLDASVSDILFGFHD